MFASYSESSTCPPSCPLSYANIGGCYAQSNMRIAGHWNRVPKRGVDFESFTFGLRALPRGSKFRHNIAGDLPGKDGRIDQREALMMVRASRHLQSWTYTHKKAPEERAFVARLNAQEGMTINLSADNLAEADRLIGPPPTADQRAIPGWRPPSPVVVMLPQQPKDWPKQTPGGWPVVVCPAVRNEGQVTCSTCGGGSGPLCARKDRRFIVGFPAHGIGHKKAEQVSRGLPVLNN
jgi:hypothetical protein